MKWHDALAQVDRSRQIKALEKILKKTADGAPMAILRVGSDQEMSKWTAQGWTVLKAPTENIYGASHQWVLQKATDQVRSDLEALR